MKAVQGFIQTHTNVREFFRIICAGATKNAPAGKAGAFIPYKKPPPERWFIMLFCLMIFCGTGMSACPVSGSICAAYPVDYFLRRGQVARCSIIDKLSVLIDHEFLKVPGNLCIKFAVLRFLGKPFI